MVSFTSTLLGVFRNRPNSVQNQCNCENCPQLKGKVRQLNRRILQQEDEWKRLDQVYYKEHKTLEAEYIKRGVELAQARDLASSSSTKLHYEQQEVKALRQFHQKVFGSTVIFTLEEANRDLGTIHSKIDYVIESILDQLLQDNIIIPSTQKIASNLSSCLVNNVMHDLDMLIFDPFCFAMSEEYHATKLMELVKGRQEDPRLYNIISRTIHRDLHKSSPHGQDDEILSRVKWHVQDNLAHHFASLAKKTSQRHLSSEEKNIIVHLCFQEYNEDFGKIVSLAAELHTNFRENMSEEVMRVVQEQGQEGMVNWKVVMVRQEREMTVEGVKTLPINEQPQNSESIQSSSGDSTHTMTRRDDVGGSNGDDEAMVDLDSREHEL